MKRNFFFQVFIAMIMVNTMSCEKKIDLSIKETKERLVIEGGILLYDDRQMHAQEIRLSSSTPFLDADSNSPVTDASVSVSDETNTYAFRHNGGGRWVNEEIVPEAGRKYILNIVWRNERYEANEEMLLPVKIDSAYYVFEKLAENPFEDDRTEGYVAQIDFVDPANSRNHYFKRLLINDSSTFTDAPSNQFYELLEDENFNGKRLTGVKVNQEYLAESGEVGDIQLLTIPVRQYDYLKALFTLTGGASLFGDPPPSKLLGNIVNLSREERYPLGYFTVAGIASRRKMVP